MWEPAQAGAAGEAREALLVQDKLLITTVKVFTLAAVQMSTAVPALKAATGAPARHVALKMAAPVVQGVAADIRVAHVELLSVPGQGRQGALAEWLDGRSISGA